jgi:hypothetical protein
MAAQYLAAASAQGDEGAEVALQELLAFKGRQGGEVVDEGDGSLVEDGPVDMNVHPTEIQILPVSWILEQDPNDCTIQVIALRSKQDIETLIQDHPDLAPFAIYTQQKNKKPLYVLLQGVYPTLESARLAKSQFPKAIQPPQNTWIRKFEKIQELLDTN